MQREFLPFLTDSQGRSLTESNGVVVTSAIPNPQDHAPEGWEKNTIQFSRNNEFRGLIKAYTTPLKFYLESAFILRYFFYSIGVETVLYFIWLKLDTNFGGGWVHKSWYKGEPDFSTFSDSDDGVEITITEGGLNKDIQANKGVVNDYPLEDDPDTVSLLNDGMEIQQNATFAVNNGTVEFNNGQHPLDLFLTSVEANSQVSAASQVRFHFSDNANLLAFGTPFLKTGNSVTNVNIDTKFGVTVTLADGISPNPVAGSRLLVRMFDDAGTAIGFTILDSWGGASNLYNRHHICNVNTTIAAVPPNTRLFALMFLTLGGVIATGDTADGVVFWQYDDADADYFKCSYLFRYKESIIPCFRAIDLGRKIISNVSGGLSTLKSNLLENDFNLLISSGDAIRGIAKPVIKTNLTDYHKSIDAVKCISFGVENNDGKLEVRRYAYQNSLITNLGDSSRLVLTVATAYIYNTAQFGYPPTDVGDANGRFAFCNTSSFSLPVKRVVNQYDAVSVYLADPFVIEIARINLDGKTTTDDQSDNKGFFFDAERVYPNNYIGNVTGIAPDQLQLIGITGLMLRSGVRFKITTGLNAGSYTVRTAIEAGGQTNVTVLQQTVVNDASVNTLEWLHYRLRRIAYTVLTGVPSPATVFNTELSPKTNANNHLNWLYGSCDKLDGKVITFTNTDKNGNLSRTDSAGFTVTERDNISINNVVMGPKIYKPYFLTFNAMSNVNLLSLMTASNGYGFFAIDGFFGYPEDIKTNDATLETQQYKLLVTGDTDLTPLIKR